MKKIIIRLMMVALFFCANKIVYAIDTEPLHKSCNIISSVLSNAFIHETTGAKVIGYIRVDTINKATQGPIQKLHEEFCVFLIKKGYSIKSYYVHTGDPHVKRHDQSLKKQKWISDCENPIPEVLETTRVIELVIDGDEFVDSFYMLQRNDRLFRHHFYRGEGHQKFFEYIYDKLQTELREDYFLSHVK